MDLCNFLRFVFPELVPMQLSGIYKTTSGLGLNCLFVLKLIHPETYSFSYFSQWRNEPKLFPQRFLHSLLAVLLQSLVRRHWTNAQYYTKVLLTKVLFIQRYYYTKVLFGTKSNQYLKTFNTWDTLIIEREWDWEWFSRNKLKQLVQRGHIIVRILDAQLQRGHRRPICAHKRSSVFTNAATDRAERPTD